MTCSHILFILECVYSLKAVRCDEGFIDVLEGSDETTALKWVLLEQVLVMWIELSQDGPFCSSSERHASNLARM